MIVKNEQALLGACLKTIKDFVDHIIIVDTGSTDDTVEIALRHGAEVHFFDWCNDFSAARNYALSFVKTPWTLWLDADDLAMNPEVIAPALEYARKNRINAIWSIYKQDQSCYQRRLQIFKTKDYEWRGAVHENPIPKKASLADGYLSDIVVLHRKPQERGSQAARQYLDILLENLLGNAWKFTGNNKNPTIDSLIALFFFV
jgi:glycosyltransferase involved in cell wall biosynthesis